MDLTRVVSEIYHIYMSSNEQGGGGSSTEIPSPEQILEIAARGSVDLPVLAKAAGAARREARAKDAELRIATNQLNLAMGTLLVGRRVTVGLIGEHTRPQNGQWGIITGATRYASPVSPEGAVSREYHGSIDGENLWSSNRFTPGGLHCWYPERAQGKVVGVDMANYAIVMNRRLFDAIWVQLVDSEGNPLVDLDLGDN